MATGILRPGVHEHELGFQVRDLRKSPHRFPPQLTVEKHHCCSAETLTHSPPGLEVQGAQGKVSPHKGATDPGGRGSQAWEMRRERRGGAGPLHSHSRPQPLLARHPLSLSLLVSQERSNHKAPSRDCYCQQIGRSQVAHPPLRVAAVTHSWANRNLRLLGPGLLWASEGQPLFPEAHGVPGHPGSWEKTAHSECPHAHGGAYMAAPHRLLDKSQGSGALLLLPFLSLGSPPWLPGGPSSATHCGGRWGVGVTVCPPHSQHCQTDILESMELYPFGNKSQKIEFFNKTLIASKSVDSYPRPGAPPRIPHKSPGRGRRRLPGRTS